MNLVAADVSRRICLFSRQRISADSRRRLRFRGLMREIFRGNLSMNRASCGSQTRGPDRASVRRSGSWSQCVRKSEWRLSMNRPLTRPPATLSPIGGRGTGHCR